MSNILFFRSLFLTFLFFNLLILATISLILNSLPSAHATFLFILFLSKIICGTQKFIFSISTSQRYFSLTILSYPLALVVSSLFQSLNCIWYLYFFGSIAFFFIKIIVPSYSFFSFTEGGDEEYPY